MPTLFQEFLQGVTFAEPQCIRNLAVLPLMAEHHPGLDYLSLPEAMEAGVITISELTEGGSVSELTVVNEGGLPILLLDGEELVGAKQNRVMNTTILLKEHMRTTIPVSCVEQGRWRYSSRQFTDSGNVMPATHRAAKHRSVSDNLRSSGQRHSDQSEVWNFVTELNEASAVPASPTGAMRDVYRAIDDDLAEMLQHFSPVEGQRGMAVFINGAIAGIEYVSQPRAFARVHHKLLRSYAIEALLVQQPGKGLVDPSAAQAVLATIGAHAGQRYDAIGYGQEHRFTGETAVGSALTLEDAVIHLSLLKPKEASRRRRRDDVDEINEMPFPRSYWVRPGTLMAGCYPGAPETREAMQKLRSLLDAGIRAVVNLMEPEETDHHGQPFNPYMDTFSQLATRQGIDVTCLRLPIADHCVPTRETMRQILDAIDAFIEHGQPVYVHCWGGKGRTGTVIGCWLARHGIAAGDGALEMVRILRRNDPTAGDPSPENRIQRNMVQNWRMGE